LTFQIRDLLPGIRDLLLPLRDLLGQPVDLLILIGQLPAQPFIFPFREIVDKAGLPRIRFHDLRHTAATLLPAQGVHPRVVIAVTMNTYSHVVPALRREAADKIDAILNPVAQLVAQASPSPKPI
jgi:integrase